MKCFWTEFIESSGRVLLLQGPVGPFFSHLQDYLSQRTGKTVYKIDFNGGDVYFSSKIERQYVYEYRGRVADFSSFLKDFITKNKIDAVVCFGDGRIYHKLTKAYCKARGG